MGNNITAIRLEDVKGVTIGPAIENERKQAICDLLQENHFIPHDKSLNAPWTLSLYLSEGQLHFDLLKDEELNVQWKLPSANLRAIIKDYFIITQSYADAIQSGNTQRLESIDMGRRGVHNEGAEKLQSYLQKYADVNFDTARRLFTLICILHIRSL